MRIVVRGLAALAAAAMLLSGCATHTQSHVAELRRSIPDARIVLMPLDVELMEMDLGGVLEPKPEWTETATRLIREELRAYQAKKGFGMREFARDFQPSEAEADLVDQLTKVHAVIGESIMLHRRPHLQLPSLGERPKWSLGEEVRVLQAKTDADYALFVHVRDSYASDARKVAMVAGLALKVGIMGGIQSGFASLVDLKTGEIVWFNQLGRPTGDLRAPAPAKETVDILLTGFPK